MVLAVLQNNRIMFSKTTTHIFSHLIWQMLQSIRKKIQIIAIKFGLISYCYLFIYHFGSVDLSHFGKGELF